MKNIDKTKEQFLKEIELLNAKIAECEKKEFKRKSSEGDLRESEKNLKSIFDNLQDVFYRIDANGIIIAGSPSAVTLYKYDSLDEIIGKHSNKFIYDLEENEKFDKELHRKGQLKNYILKHKSKDGEPVSVEVNTKILFDENGNYDGVVGVIRDISERLKAEEELRKSEERYRRLFNASRDGYTIVLGGGEILDANPRHLEMLGYSIDELKTKSFWEITPDKWIDHERNIQGKLLYERGYSDLYEKEYIREDGTVFPIEVQAFVLERGTDFDSTRIGAFVRDITERKKAEDTLRKSENRFKTYFNKGLIGMVVTSVDEGFIEANDKFCDMLGYSKEELSEISWTKLTYPEDLKADLAQFKRILSGEINSYLLEKRFIHKNGRIVHTAVSVNSVLKVDGSVDYILAMSEDITERKQAEEELEKYKDHLETLVNERTTELAEKNIELERFNKLFVDREFRIKELRDKVKELVGKIVE